MSRVRVHDYSISMDGYGAGPRQSLEAPLGVGGEALHGWVIATKHWREMHGKEGGTSGADNDFAMRGYVTDPEVLLEIARERLGREMTEAECRQYLGRACDA